MTDLSGLIERVEAEPVRRCQRPRQLVLHVTEKTYAAIDRSAFERGVSKSVILREIFNAGLASLRAQKEQANG